MSVYEAVIMFVKFEYEIKQYPMVLDRDIIDETVSKFERHYGKGNVKIEVL